MTPPSSTQSADHRSAMFTCKRYRRSYGLIFRISLRNFSIISFVRNHDREELRLLGLRVFRRPLPVRFELKRLSNLFLMEANYKALSKLDNLPNTKRILYVVDTLELVGGVETRLVSQFKYLSEQGVTPMLLTEKNDFFDALEYVNFHLDFSAPNAEELLLKLINLSKAEVVEFQMKATKFFDNVCLDRIKTLARVGVCIHNRIKTDHKKLRELDYLLTSTHRLSKNFPGATCVPNWIKPQSCFVKPNPVSNKALIISRLDAEKFPTIKNFVELCRKNNLHFYIAGTANSPDPKLSDLFNSLNLPEDALIGPIRTLDYLKEHGSDYLFVAGVGQVPLEASVLGLPAMVVTHKNTPTLSTVLNKENFSFLRQQNMTIKESCPDDECLGNFQCFLQDCKDRRIEEYDVRSCVVEQCGIDQSMRTYMQLVLGETN